MRLTYILAVVLAVTLHSSSSALSTIKDSKAVVENGASPDFVDPVHTDGQRLLRRVEKPVSNKDESEEERGFGNFVKGSMQSVVKKFSHRKPNMTPQEQAKWLAKMKREIMNE